MVGIAAMGWLLAQGAEPAQRLKAWLRITEETMVGRLFYCPLCLTFWLGLGVTLDAFSAALCAVMAEAIYRIERNTRTL